ncbi:MAG: hypothetical protein WC635_11835 [Bacteriovorax sp.]|jgi:hypothetical protein
MKNILISALIYASATLPQVRADVQSEQKENIFLSYCSHFGEGVSFSFSSCVNSNFSTIGRSIGGFYSYCSNFGKEVDYGFTSCVNSGFREAERQLNNQVWLQNCMNFDRTTLDFSFISCVNSNFNSIKRAIEQN